MTINGHYPLLSFCSSPAQQSLAFLIKFDAESDDMPLVGLEWLQIPAVKYLGGCGLLAAVIAELQLYNVEIS